MKKTILDILCSCSGCARFVSMALQLLLLYRKSGNRAGAVKYCYACNLPNRIRYEIGEHETKVRTSVTDGQKSELWPYRRNAQHLGVWLKQ